MLTVLFGLAGVVVVAGGVALWLFMVGVLLGFVDITIDEKE